MFGMVIRVWRKVLLLAWYKFMVRRKDIGRWTELEKGRKSWIAKVVDSLSYGDVVIRLRTVSGLNAERNSQD